MQYEHAMCSCQQVCTVKNGLVNVECTSLNLTGSCRSRFDLFWEGLDSCHDSYILRQCVPFCDGFVGQGVKQNVSTDFIHSWRVHYSKIPACLKHFRTPTPKFTVTFYSGSTVWAVLFLWTELLGQSLKLGNHYVADIQSASPGVGALLGIGVPPLLWCSAVMQGPQQLPSLISSFCLVVKDTTQSITEEGTVPRSPLWFLGGFLYVLISLEFPRWFISYLQAKTKNFTPPHLEEVVLLVEETDKSSASSPCKNPF